MKRAESTGLFEQLESRVLLSDTYYAWTGVDTLSGYDASHGFADSIAGVSDNGEYMWSDAATDPEDPDEAYRALEHISKINNFINHPNSKK